MLDNRAIIKLWGNFRIEREKNSMSKPVANHNPLNADKNVAINKK